MTHRYQDLCSSAIVNVRHTKGAMITLVVALGLCPAARLLAQETPAPAAGTTPAQCGIPGHHALLERMSAAFELTCEQEQKLEPLLHDEESVSKPLLRFQGFTPDEKKTVMLQVKVAARKQIRPMLTPPQQAKMDQEIDTVTKGGEGLQKGNGKQGGSKGGSEKKAPEAVDPFVAEESLSDAISKYAAFSADEKKALVLKVKTASRRPDAPAMTPEQVKTVDASIKQMSS
jgi:Spy/CpxP family protein refolding chaperone